ncbi:MAG TPA: T9SS type A sorting domain-containing protein [Ignavibacteria bacterium]|nr:T9SS type A sorting domain-containing protein [Ignavibacteria bacterium]
MKSKLLIYFLPALLVMFLIYGYSSQDDPRNDAAPHYSTDIINSGPVTSPPGADTATPAGFPYPKLWGWVYSGIPGVNGGTVGACYFGGKYIENRWNNATLYRINPDGPNGGPGTTADSNNAYNGGAGAIRDMTVAPDGSGRKFLWGGSASTVLYKMDSLGNRLASYTHAGAAYRTIAWDPNRKGFWSSNFSDNIVCRDTNGVVLKTIANTTAGKYGLAWDSTTTADSAYLWVWSQNFTVPTDTTNDLVKINIGTGQIVRTWNFNKGSNIAGGAEIFEKDNKLVLCLNFQNYGVSAYNLKDLTPPPPAGGNTLVLVHDTTITSTVPRKSDRDTLNKYLTGFIGSYTMKGFDTNTVLPDLSTFNTIILQETSFDAAVCRYLGVGARNQIKTWLATGTASSKKTLISIGADQSYNYQRTGSGGIDLVFSQDIGKYIYRVDNAMSTAPVIEGVTIDVGNQRAMSTAPPGANYWPDGASVVAGGSSVLYRYLNHTIADTVAGIGNVQPGYVVATIFQDPRYFTGGFSNVFSALVNWARANGGLITGNGSNASLTIPDNYNLSQNYPNPFNPSTKINYTIPKSGLVTLKVYDLLGKEVASLVNEVVNAGSHEVSFNASNLSSGTYFYRIKVGDFVETKKMSLLK